ncbi:hypothetical protein ACIBH1_42010 [Nonomuraea sp. NPDC050663]|uniref:hypothetical protein n=1 Tax=Nonomuraea sp. NPDC050663 TaxID=3364370 RepID=UPI0037B3CE18
MGLLFSGTAATVALLLTAAPAVQWKVVHHDRHASYDAVTVTPGGAVWVAGTRSGKPVLLKNLKRVAGPGFRVRRLASASDTRVWAFGTSRYARWDGRRWQVKPWPYGRVDRANSIGKNLWVIEDSTIFSGKAGWKARSTLRRLDGSAWRKVPTPIVVKGIDGKWAAGSVRGTAAMARWSGTAWRAVPLPAVPSSHAGQISELTDVAMDGETGRIMAVGWTAWPCGTVKPAYCGETLLLSGYPGSWTFEVRREPGIQPRAQAEPDGRGGAWIVYDAKGGGSGFLHILPDGVEAGGFPAPANRGAAVRDLAVKLGSGSVWAVGGTPSRRDGSVWAYRP